MRLLLALLPLLMAAGSMAQSESNLLVLTKDTEIRLVMAETLTSKHAYKGERVELKVAEDVMVGNALAVPRNTRVLERCTWARPRRGTGQIRTRW